MAASAIFFMVTLYLTSCTAAPNSYNDIDYKIPVECENTHGFCSYKPEGYDEIEKRAKRLLPPYLIKNVENRSGPETTMESDFDDEDENCPKKRTSESAYFYRHENTTKLDWIIQINSEYEQIITQVHCDTSRLDNAISGDQQCFQNVGLSSFLKFKCKETKANRTVLVYDVMTDKIKPTTYEISVCCSCLAEDLYID